MRRDCTRQGNKKTMLWMMAAVVLMILIWFVAGYRSIGEVEAKDYGISRQKYYTSVDIEEGDTLWGIAEEYMTEEYEDRDAFIDEVCEMNHITGNMIRTGSTILVPYYK